MENDKMEPLPDTVGDFIKMLQKYPPDARLDIAYIESYYNEADYDTSALLASVKHLENINYLKITLK